MAEILFIASLFSFLFPMLATWHRDRVKDGHNPAVLRAIRIWASCSIVVIALSGANAYVSRKQAAALRVAEQSLQVLRSLSKYRIELLDLYFQLFRNAVTVRSFVTYESARISTGHPEALPPWESHVNEAQRTELAQAKSAFERTQKIAREVLMQHATYPAFVPKAIEEWATFILAAKFSQVPELIDPYREGAQSIMYAKLLGGAIGDLSEAEKEVTKKLTQ